MSRTGYSRWPAQFTCGSCGNEWYGEVVAEYGTEQYDPEDCRRCGETKDLTVEPSSHSRGSAALEIPGGCRVD